MMENVVEVNHLVKVFGNEKVIDDISFTIEANKIYGLLGRNGAGKTTIMHILTGQLFVTSGDIKVFGEDPYENNKVLSQLCFIKESQKYPESFHVRDVIQLAEHFFPNWDRDYAYKLIEDFRLPLKRTMKKLSRGMRSAVGIIIGLASRAPLTIFDEPYLGLDAAARSMFYDRLIEDYSTFPRTIILSTHLIDEISELLEHVMIIDRGKLLVNENADELRERAYTIAGTKSKVDTFTAGKTVISKSEFGALASATLMGKMKNDERRQAESLGLEFVSVPLQQLFVHITNENSNRKEVVGK